MTTWCSKAGSLAVALLLCASIAPASVVIDNFTGPVSAIVGPGGASTAGNNVAAAGALGGARRLDVTRTAGNGIVSADIDLSGAGIFSFGSGPNDKGFATLSYDGSNDATFNPIMGPFDLTQAGANNGLAFLYKADLAGALINVQLYSSATNFSNGSVALSATGFAGAPSLANILFSSLSIGGGTGVNLSSVTGIKLTIDGQNAAAVDVQLSSFQSDFIPEPASLSLVAMAGLFLKRRR